MFASLGGDSAAAYFGMLPRPRVNFSEFSYDKGVQIFGENEPAEYVYEVAAGAVRSYKLLLDGRRQIGAFHLVGDIFGLENAAVHRFTAEAIVDTRVRLVKRQSSGAHRRKGRAGRTRSVEHDNDQPSACRRPHAAPGTQNRIGAGCSLSPGDG